MNYRDKVIRYFGFMEKEITVLNKTKRNIVLSGYPKLGYILMYIFIVAFTTLIVFLLKWNMTVTVSVGGVVVNRKPLIIFLDIICPIIIIIYIIIKSRLLFKKIHPKTKNISIYQRDVPSNLKPAHVRMLITDGVIDECTISSTILDLVYRGYLILSKNEYDNEQIYLIKTNKNYDNLLKYEKFLIEWFIDKCGNGTQVSNKSLKQVLSSRYSGDDFDEFQALVLLSFPLGKYYDKRKTKTIIYSVLGIFSFFIIFLPGCLAFFTYFLGAFLFLNPRYIPNQRGVDEKDSWLDLKKYLVDFSNIKDKTSEMVEVWDFYLTYSIAFNIDSKAKNEIESFFEGELHHRKKVSDKDQLNKLFYGGSNKHHNNLKIEKDIEEEMKIYDNII